MDNNLALRLTPRQRMDMQMKGMSPLNPVHVQRYINGRGLSSNEKQERLQKLLEGTSNLGGAHEREIVVDDTKTDPEHYERFTPMSAQQTSRNMRQRLNEDFGDPDNQPIKSFTADDLLSFRKPKQQQKPVDRGSISQQGFDTAKDYLNAFVRNLESPSYESRINLFKALKICLEGELKYKKQGQGAYDAYRKGVMSAETAMMKKLGGDE